MIVKRSQFSAARRKWALACFTPVIRKIISIQHLIIKLPCRLCFLWSDLLNGIADVNNNEIINGNMEYAFDALQEFEGLANALNVMLARLLGRPEPGEEEEGSAAWRPDMLAIEEISHGVTDVDVQRLAAEPEDAYHARLFQEYMAARTSAGLSVEGITAPGFSQKLRANEAMLKARHKSNMVRFVVHSSAGQVSLRPIRIG